MRDMNVYADKYYYVKLQLMLHHDMQMNEGLINRSVDILTRLVDAAATFRSADQIYQVLT